MFGLSSLSFALRILLLGLLMTGVLVKPMVAFAGELHEAEHVLLTADDGLADDGSSDLVDPSDSKNPWHALMHYGDCCGQSTALLPLATLGSITPTVTDLLPPLSVEFQPTAHHVAFRPPITA